MSANFKARQKVYRAKKKPEESIRQWITRLENLANECGFDQQRQASIVRDIFVIGLGHSPIKKKLYKKIDENNRISIHILQKIAFEEENKRLIISLSQVKREPSSDLEDEPANKNMRLSSEDEETDEDDEDQDENGDEADHGNTRVGNQSCYSQNSGAFSDEDNQQLILPYNLALVDNCFQGREEVVEEIYNIFKEERTVVISGLFAIGKTQLVKKYVWDRKEYYKNNIIWITYENKTQLETVFINLAKRLKLIVYYDSENLSILDLVILVYSHFDNSGKFIFIYDNIPSRNILTEYLITFNFNNINILITSPNSDWKQFKTINLKPMCLSESLLLFKTATKKTSMSETQEQTIKNILKTFHGIPLLVHRFSTYFANECNSENRHSLVVNDINQLINILYDNKFPNWHGHRNQKTMLESFLVTLNIIDELTKNVPIVHEIIQKFLKFSVYYNLEIVCNSLLEDLLNNGFFSNCDKNSLNKVINTLIYFSFVSKENEGSITMNKIIKDLIRLKLKICNIDGCSIHEAAENGNLEQIKQMINNDEYLVYLTKYEHKHTLLHCAAMGGHVHILKYLIRDLKIPINIRNGIQDTALHLATLNGRKDAVLFLIEEGASVNILNKDHKSILHYACYCESTSIDVVKLLIEKGCAVNCRNKNDATPLHNAARKGRTKLVSYLLETGAEIDALNKSGLNALHFAAYYGHVMTSLKLLEKGCSPSVHDVKGKTPLMLAEAEGHDALVKVFHEYEDYKTNDIPSTSSRRNSCTSDN